MKNKKVILPLLFLFILTEIALAFATFLNHSYGEKISYTEFMELVEDGYVEKVEVTNKNQLIIRQYRSNEKLYTINIDQSSYIQYLTNNGVEVDSYTYPIPFADTYFHVNTVIIVLLLAGCIVPINIGVQNKEQDENVNSTEQEIKPEKKEPKIKKKKIPKASVLKDVKNKIKDKTKTKQEEKEIKKNKGIEENAEPHIIPEEIQYKEDNDDELKEHQDITFVNEDLESLGFGVYEELGEIPEQEQVIEEPPEPVLKAEDIDKEIIKNTDVEHTSQNVSSYTEEKADSETSQKKDNKEIEETDKVKEFDMDTPKERKYTKEESIHETGHALMLVVSSRGEKFPEMNLLIPYTDNPSDFSKQKYDFLTRAKALLAGSLLEDMKGFPQNDSWKVEDEAARNILLEMVGVCKVVKGYNMAVSKYGLSNETKKRVDEAVKESYERCKKEIHMFFEKYESLADRVSEELKDKGIISAVDLETMVKEEIPNLKTCIPNLYNKKLNRDSKKKEPVIQKPDDSDKDEEIYLNEVSIDSTDSMYDELDMGDMDNIELEMEPDFDDSEEPAPPGEILYELPSDFEETSDKKNQDEQHKKNKEPDKVKKTPEPKKPGGFQTQISGIKTVGKPSLLSQASNNGMKSIGNRKR